MNARRTWSWFALGALLGGAGLAGLSEVVLARARATTEAALVAQLAEDERAALARMDLLFAPLLARAVARGEARESYSMTYLVELPDGQLAGRTIEPPPVLAARADAAWSTARPAFELPQLADRGAELLPLQQRAGPRSSQEFQARSQANLANNPNVAEIGDLLVPSSSIARFGALVADWDPSSRALLFVRRLEDPSGTAFHQAFRFDWPTLEQHLLAVVRDLFPEARLEPVASDAPPSGDRLATLPARLVVPRTLPNVPLDRGLAAALGGAWALALVATAGAALALRASLADAARQRRFTAAVTHELRTPLTTFRLYGEMLAHGMVPEERRQEYLTTIEREAGRLGALVENVLAHARLERGTARPARERVRVTRLLERHRPVLAERCRRAGTELAVELGDADELELTTDVEGVGLVLANLVDNACKYGVPAAGHAPARPIRLSVTAGARRVGFALEDQGPGIPPAQRAAIFRPFERGGRDESDPAPGVGLGLALGRELARALGGELVLEPAQGARFVLYLPRG